MNPERAASRTMARINHIFDLPATQKRVVGEDGELPEGKPEDGAKVGAAWDASKLHPTLFKAFRIYGQLALKKGKSCIRSKRAL